MECRANLDSLPVMLWAAGAEQARSYFNRAWLEFVGRPLEAELEMGWLEGVHPEDRPGCLEMAAQAFARKERWEVAYRLRRYDGQYRWVHETAVPQFSPQGELAGYFGCAIDVTAHREAEERAVRLAQQAHEASVAKSHFLACMSHEIRTPMNGILGMADLLTDTPLSGEQRSCVEAIRNSGEALLVITNDILDFSKIEAGKIELESIPFDLENTLEDMIEVLATKAAEKSLELLLWYAPEAPRRFIGDPGRIRQIATNFVSNAIKFTERGHVLVEVEAKALNTNQAEMLISVHDTGIGIPADRLPRLFEKFSQVDASTTRKYGGTGLGLAISRQLAEIMGGSVHVVSQVGEGSAFSVQLPLQLDQRTEVKEVPKADLTGVRVLIVDDHQLNRFITAEVCSRWKMRVEEAASGAQALEALQAAVRGEDPFRLVVLDYLMPEMDGEQVVRRIRLDPALRSTLVVMLTSAALRGDAARMSRAGCNAYLVKPVRASVLLDALASLVGAQNAGMSIGLVTRHSLAESKALSQAPSRPNQPPKRRVLLCEDNPVNQRVGRRLLEKLGCEVDLAQDGLEALQMAQRKTYEAIFMDCNMPGMDGFDATAALRRSEQGGRRTPIIALTAAAMQEDRERCLAAGMDDYLSKPVKLEGLSEVLDRWTGPAA